MHYQKHEWQHCHGDLSRLFECVTRGSHGNSGCVRDSVSRLFDQPLQGGLPAKTPSPE